jgi:hypothetical protein
MLDECPFCHKPFAVQEVSKEQVDSALVKSSTQPGRVGTTRLSRLGSGQLGQPPSPERPEYAPSEDFLTYQVPYRCKYCGKEWTKLEEKEVDIPRSYVGAEQEKTDVDAGREEEAAREEDYARR